MASKIAQFVVQLNRSEVRRFALSAPVMTIGRTPENALALSHPLVSRCHAELRITAQGVTLTDLGSRSGTVVNGLPLLANQPVLLEPGALVQIGPFTLEYGPAGVPATNGHLDEALSAGHAPDVPTNGKHTEARFASTVPLEPGVPSGDLTCVDAALPTRIAQPMALAAGPVSRYLAALPVVFQDSDFLGRFLLIFETLWEPLEQRQDFIELYFNPRTCPEHMLGWLASWLDLSLPEHWPEARRRRILAEAIDLRRWKGTRYGLARLIELCTGVSPEILEEPDAPFVFRIHMRATANTVLDTELVETLVRQHKPAHVGYILDL
jgi:phage tail-like protein